MKLVPDTSPQQDLIETLKITLETQEIIELNHKPDKPRNYRYWTLEEDEKLSGLARDLNYDWRKITQFFPSRNSSEVEQRWRQRIDPSTKKTSWSKEEDIVLESMYQKFGGKWKIIANYLPGRLPSSIKNRFYGKIHKQIVNQKNEMKVLDDKKSLIDEDELLDSLLDLSDNEESCSKRTDCINELCIDKTLQDN
jgi:hypothetical protein